MLNLTTPNFNSQEKAMHQAYFERKMSQPSTGSTSRSLTPKPFARLQEDPTKSPDRINTEYSQFAHHSPTVNSHKNLTANISFLGSSKIASKSREQMLNTERLKNRSQTTQYYNPKNIPNVTTELMRGKSHNRSNYIITKTEPSIELETSYASQVNKLLQKINKLKTDLTQSQERENQYLNKLSNLEKENKSLQMVIEEKDKRIQDITQKSKEDKIRMYQFLTELETHKQANSDQYRDDVSTVRLSELCDSSRKVDKGQALEKGTQTIDGGSSAPGCSKCESVSNYCEYLTNKLNEVDQASKYILKEYNLMKESLMKARRAETDYVKARSEIEKRAVEIQNDFDKQANFYSELVAENFSVRKTLKEAIECNTVALHCSTDQKKLMQNKSNKERSQQKILPVPASLRALVGAERVLKAAAN